MKETTTDPVTGDVVEIDVEPIAERTADVVVTVKAGTLKLTDAEARKLYSALRKWYGRGK